MAKAKKAKKTKTSKKRVAAKPVARASKAKKKFKKPALAGKKTAKKTVSKAKAKKPTKAAKKPRRAKKVAKAPTIEQIMPSGAPEFVSNAPPVKL